MAKKMIEDYFKTVDPFTKDLPASIQRSTVQAVREEVRVVQDRTNTKRGEYQKVSTEDKARIGQYAARNGVSPWHLQELHVTWLREHFVAAQATGLEGMGTGFGLVVGSDCVGFGQAARAGARLHEQKGLIFLYRYHCLSKFSPLGCICAGKSLLSADRISILNTSSFALEFWRKILSA